MAEQVLMIFGGVVVGMIVQYFAFKWKSDDRKQEDQEKEQDSSLKRLSDTVHKLITQIQLVKKDTERSIEQQERILAMGEDVSKVKAETSAQWKRIDDLKERIVKVEKTAFKLEENVRSHQTYCDRLHSKIKKEES